MAAGTAFMVMGTSFSTPAFAAKQRTPVIHLGLGDRGHAVHPTILGANMRWARNADGLWNSASGSVYPEGVTRAKQIGLATARYPGGTVATMFNWKNAVTHTGCQIDGHWDHGEGFQPSPHSSDFGPNQFMSFVAAVGAQPIFMTPLGETPKDAADWVEYMNARVGANPNGGRDWAKLRAATGHPAPYHVRYWEIGNESHVAPARYGFSSRLTKALHQYAFGGQRNVTNEALGKGCLHPTAGVPSNGQANQVFSILFPSIRPRTLSVTVNGSTWAGVSHLNSATADAKVYSANLITGEVTFGDGVHGAIPPQGAVVRASYENRYAGFFDFARKMKRVDPHIDVCSSWGLPAPSFTQVAAGRHFDCQTAHPMTNSNSRVGTGGILVSKGTTG